MDNRSERSGAQLEEILNEQQQVADSKSERREERRGGGWNESSIPRSECGCTELAIFPPGPADLDAWRELLSRRPDLAPAVSAEEAEAQSQLRGSPNGVATGLDRVERLRSGGNGVVPLQAAYALVSLVASLRARCIRERAEKLLAA